MAKKIHYCENHPDVVSTESCSQCKKRICYNCRIVAFNQVFCSGQCLTVFVAKGIVNIAFGVSGTIIKTIFWPFRRINKLRHRGLVVGILTLGLIVCVFFIWKLTTEVTSLKEGTTLRMTAEGTVDTSQILPPKIYQPTDGGMVSSTTLDILGEAESNRVVTLSINSKLVRAVLPEGGKFAFNDVRLHRGINRLEVRAITEDGRVSTLQTLMLTHATPTLSYLARDFRRGPVNKKAVTLTFDGGSINNVADEILDILRDREVKSTFFLTGEFIRKYPRTVKRIVFEGHEVGNHTWSHPHLTSFENNRKQTTLPGMTEEKIREEFSRTASLFELVTSSKMSPIWRAPFGEYNEEILQWAAKAGYRHVGWTVGRGWEETMDTMDWVADKNSEAYRSADEIVKKILNHGKGKKYGSNGAIILMHLGTHRKDDFPHKKLPEIIDGLRNKGYQIIKVTEMISEME